MASLYSPPPWETLPQRSGDPLGFRYCANQIADAWAPGISGRQRDARWLTLLCKALAAMNCDGKTTDRDCYKLMSKFERGILVEASNDLDNGKGRHLPGKRAAANTWPERYRYYGPWGTYKPLLKNCGLIESGYHWKLTEQGENLAKNINIQLTLDKRTPSDVKKGLNNFANWFPRSESCKSLEPGEIKILCPLLFGKDEDGEKRTKTVDNLGKQDFKSFCNNQPFDAFAFWFDEFTQSCLKVLKEALDTTQEGQPILFNKILLTSQNFSPPANFPWDGPEDLADRVARSATKVQTIIDWHIEHSIKPFFQADGKGNYIRVAPGNTTMMTRYSYRLWNLWCLAQQICPKKFKNIQWPKSWLDRSTQAGDEEGEGEDDEK